MASWRLDIAYDGTGFRGWAHQPGQRTVQGELESALATVLRRPVGLTVAGRTDAGVHAWGQVASFELDDAADGQAGLAAQSATAHEPLPVPSAAGLKRSLNALTPPDLAVNAVTRCGQPFDARRDALARRYCYRVETGSPPSPFERGRALWWPYPLERATLDACAEALLGTHDFTAFTPTRTEHVRFDRDVFEARWQKSRPRSGADGPVLEFWVEADAFMRSMVRTLVGTMLEVAGGRRTVAEFERLLAGAPRPAAGETAPPQGLYLAGIRYPAAGPGPDVPRT